jgi:uroporphyrin-III C-methyltransferase/precorrin-2 dehydrogenase/sirohydrochlorin ferrochelatase
MGPHRHRPRDRLIAAGRDPATPAAVLARGTRPDAPPRRRLDGLAVLGKGGRGPALLVIGEVVARSAPWRRQLGALIAREAA